jgi:hypothetical protein
MPSLKRIPAIFFRTRADNEPVRIWLKGSMPRIGNASATTSSWWSSHGLLECRHAGCWGDGLHETRTSLSGNRIARVIFYVDRKERMVLLHAFIKKSRATPADDLALARSNRSQHERGLP